MRKIPTMFVRNPDNMSEVTREVTPGCEAAIEGKLRATEKFDGTAVLYRGGKWWKRYTLRQGKICPAEFVPAQEEPTENGKLPGWVPVTPKDKWHLEGIRSVFAVPKATYELIGPKIQGNPYRCTVHSLFKHGSVMIYVVDCSFDGLKDRLMKHKIEGIVFWNEKEPVCKIKRKDFGLPWPVR